MFDRVVCINLDRRRERWLRFERELPGDWPFDRPVRVAAVDGFRLPLPNAAWPPGAWGCMRSHLRVWEDALSGGVQALLVFEDDAAFCEDFADRAKAFLAHVPDDWDQLYFGGEHMFHRSLAPEGVHNYVLRCTDVNRTHAYAMRRRMLAVAYRHVSAIPQAGEQLTRLDYHVDNKLGELHQSGEFKVYAPRDWLVGQAAGPSDVAGARYKNTQWWPLPVEKRLATCGA